MSKRLCVAGALAAGLLMTGLAAGSATAAPLAKTEIAMPGVTLVRGRGPGGFGNMGRGPGIGHSFHFNGGPHIGHMGHGGPHFSHHGHFGRGIRFYPGFYGYAPYYNSYYYDDDYYAYSDDCGWLKRRALRTNSRYWWRRYHACRDSY
jgi:hypothetical protein